MKNLWNINEIFRSFEKALGLRMNFFKNGLIRVKADLVFLSSPVEFLCYEIETPPFEYPSFPVGGNP